MYKDHFLVLLISYSAYISLQFHVFPPNRRYSTEEAPWVRANLTRVTSPPNSTTGGSHLIFSVPFSYILFIFYLSWFTLPDFLLLHPWLPCQFYLDFITTTRCRSYKTLHATFRATVFRNRWREPITNPPSTQLGI